MTGDLLKCNVLATHTIANVSETLARKLEPPERYRSIGILTADSDDVTYCALDEATKAAAVEVVALFEPPSETNFGGGLLTGTQSACKAACEAFAEAVKAVAARPREV